MAKREVNNTVPGYGPFINAGVPSAGTSQVDTLTIDATGGTFKLSAGGQVTAAISWSATNNTLVANIDAALEALSTVGTGGVTTAVGTMTAGVGTITLTSAGNLAAKALPGFYTVYSNSLTGTATCSIPGTSGTPGVDASFRGMALKGAIVLDSTNGKEYINSGTNSLVQVWTVVGSQS